MDTTDIRTDAKVAVLVDCDNTTPEILEHALSVVAQFGRVIIRRGYGNHATLANKWQEALVRLAFTPCLQYQYAAGKNTADIALALDAIEALFDRRADTFCIVTSDSDFSYLCRKLRERGSTVLIVGEAKTPAALRNASDQFFEWVPKKPKQPTAAKSASAKSAAPKPQRAPGLEGIEEAVRLLAADTPDGRVHVGGLGSYLRRKDPGFTPRTFGQSGLVNVLKIDPLLDVRQEPGGHWTVALAASNNAI
ncbi:NYN domain-containing protein [Roseateles sp.]|uniref:NYN domain-containing protein n=1 Tax=Roseateles sp. TaxID=1971397 RepID=UPI002F3EA600